MATNDEFKAEMMARYAPIFALHPEEDYSPMSTMEFIANAELRLLNRELKADRPKLTHRVLQGPGQLTVEKLVRYDKKYSSRRLQLHVDEGNRGRGIRNDLDDVPMYAVAKDVVEDDGSLEAIEINYIIFFAYNGPYNIVGEKVGGHVGDFEHVTMRLCPNGGLQGVYFNAHRNVDGNWVPAKGVKMVDGRPYVYISKNSHGCYPSAGIKPRIYGFANDLCSDGGPQWRPSRILRLAPYQSAPVKTRGSEVAGKSCPRITDEVANAVEVVQDLDGWLEFSGYWGTVPGPKGQDWFRTAENPVSKGWFKRLFFPF